MKNRITTPVKSLAIAGKSLAIAGIVIAISAVSAQAVPAQIAKSAKAVFAEQSKPQANLPVHSIANLGKSFKGLNFKFTPKFKPNFKPKFKPKTSRLPSGRPNTVAKPGGPAAPKWNAAKPSSASRALPSLSGLRKASPGGGFTKGVLPIGPRNLGKGSIVIGSKAVRKARRFNFPKPKITVARAALFTGIGAFVALQFVPNIIIGEIDFNSEDENQEAAQN
ncbi:MAG: hypothetical protein JKY99_00680 [Rhizobiales bacterium]|nr:hypothetical protein [Hyphomicrobiales bacterium]